MRRALAVALAATAVLAPGCGGNSPPPSQRELAQRDAARFLEKFTNPDGRVVRRDQGGDTVSEGQAYAMLLAVATDNRQKFAKVWGWTQRNLQRSDALLSWHWQDGHVDDDTPSADADLDAAHALALASYRFKRPDYADEAHRIGQAVRATETINTPAGGVLAAGPWATAEGVTNPSYTDPRAISVLSRLGDHGSWKRLNLASTAMVARAADSGALPPDWATVEGDGSTNPTGPPGKKSPPTYSFDAVRVPIRFAASCSRTDRGLAARLWPRLRRQPALLPRTLDGRPAGEPKQSTAAMAGAAAAAAAAGKRGDARRLLAKASASEEAKPTYFGSALVALTRVGVMTPMLGRCP